MKQRMRWLAVAGVLTLVAVACSNNNDNGGGGSTGGGGGSTGPTAIDTIGTGEGQLSLIAWPGYTEKALGEAVRGPDRMPGHREVRQHVGRDGEPDASGRRHRVRRRVRVG